MKNQVVINLATNLEFYFFQEFDTPAVLLENPDGFLTELVNQTGPTMKKKLLQIAQKSGNVQAEIKLTTNQDFRSV